MWCVDYLTYTKHFIFFNEKLILRDGPYTATMFMYACTMQKMNFAIARIKQCAYDPQVKQEGVDRE